MNKIFLAILTCALVVGCIAIRPTERINFEAPDAYPEGIAYDSSGAVYYVSSARTASIGKVTPAGAYAVFYADSSLKSSYGMKIHPDGKRLFVCVSDANYSKFTSPDTRKKLIRLLGFELTSGKKVVDIDLSALLPGDHFGNDLTFDHQGNAYVTDSYAHAIYKIDLNGNASVFAKNKMFETKGVGLNGIVYHPSGFLLADNSNTGALYKIDIKDPSKVSKVKINQFFMGADGLLWKDSNTLVVVVNGNNDKIFQLTSQNNWDSAEMKATTLIADRFTYPATATRNGEDIWIMNARFNELVDSNNVPSKTFAIQKAVFKPIPEKLRK